MNRALQKQHQRRCALKNNTLLGGGLAVNPEATIVSENGVPYPENQHYSDCYDPVSLRPGALTTPPNVELAQTPMAGGYQIMSAAQLAAMAGKRGGSRRAGCGLMKGGQIMSAAQLAAMAGKRGGFRSTRSATRRACGCNMRGGSRRGCGCSMFKMRGGLRSSTCGQPAKAWLGGKRRKTRKQRGGNKGGFELNVADNVGGSGPIAEPVRTAIPCDARAGMQNPFTATPVQVDSRAAFGYSLTPNTTTPSFQAGGSLSERIPNFEYHQTGAGYGGNAYDASCYRAPGSEMPVYPATSAGFHFTPSTEAGATLPDGITAYNEVVAHTARLGGAYRKSRKSHRKSRKSHKKTRKGRKSRRVSRKH